MQVKIILLITILAYSIITAQSYMYIIALKNVQNSMDAGSYIEFRKLLDSNFRANYKWAVYAALITNLLLIMLTVKSPGSLLFITTGVAFVALLADVLLMMKGNMPINNLINTWTRDNYPANWKDYRAQWLLFFKWRQIVTIAGFIILLAGAIFKR